MTADRFTWNPGDVYIVICPTCAQLAEAILTASSADEVTEREDAYAHHVYTHDVLLRPRLRGQTSFAD